MIPKRSFSRVYPQRWAQVAILLGFCLILYFPNLGRWDLWNPDEPRYAQVAREMVQRGDWVLLHLNGAVYGEKPPLFFWLIAFSSHLWQEFTSFSVRFPSALFGALAVLITFFLGRNLFSYRAGFLSGFILATSFEFAYLATRANIDATLTFFTTASLFCFYQWYQTPREEKEDKKHTAALFLYAFYAAMGLATLTKGPVGFLLPSLVVFVFLVVQKDWKKLKAMKIVPGIALLFGIVLAWYLPALLKGGRPYLDLTLFKQTIGRYATGWSHLRPFYYYFIHFPIDFMPWTVFLPGAYLFGSSREMAEKRRSFLFLLTWFAVIFIFFSFSKGKRGLYLLPLFPATSLMVGKLWEDFISNQIEHFERRWITYPFYGLMGLVFLAGVALPWIIYEKFPLYTLCSLPIAFLMVGSSLATYLLFRWRHYGAVFLLLIVIMGGAFFYVERVVFPLVNPYKSARFISQEITSRIQPGERLALYQGTGTGHYNFYTGIVPILELETMDELLNFLRSEDRVYCLLKSRDLPSLKAKAEIERLEINLIVRRGVGGDDMLLISNR